MGYEGRIFCELIIDQRIKIHKHTTSSTGLYVIYTVKGSYQYVFPISQKTSTQTNVLQQLHE